MTSAFKIDAPIISSAIDSKVFDAHFKSCFDDITRVAAMVCECRHAALTLLQGDLLYVKSGHNISADSIKREKSLCYHALETGKTFLTQKANEDPRFCRNDIVNEIGEIKFYVGVPIFLENGEGVGTLCVMDTEEKNISPKEIKVLEQLAISIKNTLELRLKNEEIRKHIKRSIPLTLLNQLYAIDNEYTVETLLSRITRVLGLKYAFVGHRMPENPNEVVTDVFVADGEVQENFTYFLENTPCEVALNAGDICIYPENVFAEFPKDLMLKDMGIEGYIGTQLKDENRIFVLLDTKPIDRTIITESVVEFLRTKISNEIKKIEIERRENILNSLLSNIDGVVGTIDKKGKWTYANGKMAELFQCRLDQVIGHTTEEILGEEKARFFSKKEEFVMKSGKPISVAERWHRENGEEIILQAQRFPITNEAGEIEGQGVVGIDVTEQIRRQDEAYHQNKLKELGEKVALVAHEVNNPLGIIRLTVDLIKNIGEENPKKVLDLVGALNEPIDRIRFIVDDLRVKSAKEKEKLRKVNLKDILQAVTSSLELYYRKDLDALDIVLCTEEPLFVKGVGRLLKQVFVNLISNARDAVSEAKEKRITVNVDKVGDKVLISVEDTGVGINKEHLAHIFNNFFTTKETGKGTGIGLHFCQRTIEEHGGEITVQSEVGVGSTFTVALPLVPEE